MPPLELMLLELLELLELLVLVLLLLLLVVLSPRAGPTEPIDAVKGAVSWDGAMALCPVPI